MRNYTAFHCATICTCIFYTIPSQDIKFAREKFISAPLAAPPVQISFISL